MEYEHAKHQNIRMVGEHQIAELLGCTISNIRAMRHKGNGPPFYKLNRMVRYNPTEVQEWLANKRVTGK